MEEKGHGGKRRGAGRKGVIDKKQQIVLYVPGKDVLKFGSPDKMKEKLKGFINEFGSESKINYQPTTEASFDGKRVFPINDEPLTFSKSQGILKSFDYYRATKRGLDNDEDWQVLKAEILADQNLTSKEKTILTTTNL